MQLRSVAISRLCSTLFIDISRICLSRLKTVISIKAPCRVSALLFSPLMLEYIFINPSIFCLLSKSSGLKKSLYSKQALYFSAISMLLSILLQSGIMYKLSTVLLSSHIICLFFIESLNKFTTFLSSLPSSTIENKIFKASSLDTDFLYGRSTAVNAS